MVSINDIALAEVGDVAIPDVLEMEVLNTETRRAESQGSLPSIGATLDLRGSWYPKITPFRLLNILIPISTATAKAVTSFRGNSTVPETLEWISGVVVFLLLFHAGYYESDQKPPRCLAWAFETDCMDYLWRLLGFFYIPRPHYNSVERSDPLPTSTLYRHLVVNCFVSFGLTKAWLNGSGFSAASIWVEWLLAGLYIAGLYENNSVGIWPTFFEESRDDFGMDIGIDIYRQISLGFITITTTFMIIFSIPWLRGLYLAALGQGSLIYSKVYYPPDLQEPMKYRLTPPDSANLAIQLLCIIVGVFFLIMGLVILLWQCFGKAFGKALNKTLKGVVVRTIVHLSVFLVSLFFLIINGGAMIWLILGIGNRFHMTESWRMGVMTSFLFQGLMVLPSFFCLWWSVRNVTRDIAKTIVDRLFPVAFRRLHYAFQEIGDAFQDTSPV
ncbi:hypothetical protein GALMADRAFT_152949 [Galerina marginata CBS 339.88]|uniref:Uncharacterized protein n=1 Tax=Galerina marginata (strain CBS 339.88) TaxID=685588 RepID=A0A067TIM5_GALM3|nr:hypothetical protein GALMADRAFT_152949 [Galerina marginata CBS 339.88]